jgi:hypothetical protein
MKAVVTTLRALSSNKSPHSHLLPSVVAVAAVGQLKLRVAHGEKASVATSYT